MRAARLPEGLKPDIRCEEMFASNAGVLRGERGQRAGTVANCPCALSPFTPENSGIARKHLFTPDVWLQPFWKSGRSHFFGLTRPIRVRLRYGSQVRSTELQRSNCLLHCPFHYMLDVQFT